MKQNSRSGRRRQELSIEESLAILGCDYIQRGTKSPHMWCYQQPRWIVVARTYGIFRVLSLILMETREKQYENC